MEEALECTDTFLKLLVLEEVSQPLRVSILISIG